MDQVYGYILKSSQRHCKKRACILANITKIITMPRGLSDGWLCLGRRGIVIVYLLQAQIKGFFLPVRGKALFLPHQGAYCIFMHWHWTDNMTKQCN